MASTKAVQGRFGRLAAYDRARKELFAEGISSSKIYLDPLRPSVEDLVDMITSGVRSSFTYAGASSVPEFHERATVGLQGVSAAAIAPWLAQVRANARSVPVQAQLMRSRPKAQPVPASAAAATGSAPSTSAAPGEARWDGAVVFTLPAR